MCTCAPCIHVYMCTMHPCVHVHHASMCTCAPCICRAASSRRQSTLQRGWEAGCDEGAFVCVRTHVPVQMMDALLQEADELAVEGGAVQQDAPVEDEAGRVEEEQDGARAATGINNSGKLCACQRVCMYVRVCEYVCTHPCACARACARLRCSATHTSR